MTSVPVLLARHRRVVVLYAVSAGGAVLEAVGLKASGMNSALPLAAQATALLPLGVFHDLRWIFVYGSSWGAVGAELLASLVLRTTLYVVLVRAAWPGAPPPWQRLARAGAVGTVASMVAMSPWASMSFIGGVISLSFPILGAIAGAFVTAAVLLPHAGTTPRWWAHWPPWRAVAYGALSFAMLTVAAIGIGYSPGLVVLVTAGAAGALNGWLLRQVVRACAGAAPARIRLSSILVPLGMAAAVVALVVGEGSVLSQVIATVTPAQHLTQPPPPRNRVPVMLVDGFESQWNGGRPALRFPGFYVTEFSYRGLGPAGHPLPYSSDETTQALPLLARRLGTQLRRLHRLSGHRVDVLAVSEGTLVVREYLATHRRPPLRAVVLGSPLPRPARVWYPPAHRQGWGFLGEAESSLLARIVTAEDPGSDIQPQMPMVRSLENHGPLFRQRSLCPVPGVKVVALLPLTAAVADPPGPVAGVPDGVVPAVHADLLSLKSDHRLVERLFAGKPFPHFFGWGLAFQVSRYSASAWEVPALPIANVPAWHGRRARRWGDAAFGSYGCPAKDHPGSGS